MKCPWGCDWESAAAEYNEHYKICPKRVCPKCGNNNVFFYRVDGIECLTCGHKWIRGEVPKIEEAPQVQKLSPEKTWLIRNETRVEAEGKVEEPLETPVEAPEEEANEETSEETPETLVETTA